MDSSESVGPLAGLVQIAVASAARFRSISHRANRALLLSSTQVSSNWPISFRTLAAKFSRDCSNACRVDFDEPNRNSQFTSCLECWLTGTLLMNGVRYPFINMRFKRNGYQTRCGNVCKSMDGTESYGATRPGIEPGRAPEEAGQGSRIESCSGCRGDYEDPDISAMCEESSLSENTEECDDESDEEFPARRERR